MDNNYFDDNYENLPACPFDPCMKFVIQLIIKYKN